MNKSTILVFILSVMIFASIGAVAVIMIPDSNPEMLTVKKYESIAREDFVFEDTKNISLDSIEQTYEVDRTYLNQLLINKDYLPGTTNPFQSYSAPSSGSTSGSGSTTPSK